jgi:putative transposase
MVRDVASMSPGRRGLAVRELAAREHLTPWGERVRVSRVTLDRWVRAWREGGFEALVPAAREGVPRTPAGVLELAVALKREAPERTAAQIVRIIREREGARSGGAHCPTPLRQGRPEPPAVRAGGRARPVRG